VDKPIYNHVTGILDPPEKIDPAKVGYPGGLWWSGSVRGPAPAAPTARAADAGRAAQSARSSPSRGRRSDAHSVPQPPPPPPPRSW
jgi:hypothetical protein